MFPDDEDFDEGGFDFVRRFSFSLDGFLLVVITGGRGFDFVRRFSVDGFVLAVVKGVGVGVELMEESSSEQDCSIAGGPRLSSSISLSTYWPSCINPTSLNGSMLSSLTSFTAAISSVSSVDPFTISLFLYPLTI